MLVVRFIRFICGYICITVVGDYPERFLNLCVQGGSKIFNTRKRSDSFEFCLFARDYKKIRIYRRKCGVRLKIRYRRGLPFILRRYQRIGLAVGAAIFVAMLIIMPKFVWSINVNGNSQLEYRQVISALETVGISIGTPLSRVDADNMRLRLALLLPEISWASINIEGTAVNVEIRETTQKIEQNTGYCNLVADFDGIVTAVYVRSGSSAVKVGDAVVKGDLLVSGTESYKDGATFFRHSDADIIATVERTATVTVPINKAVTSDIGDGRKRTVLSLFGIDIPLYIGDIGYISRAEYTENNLVIGGVTLPVTAITSTFYETEQHNVMLTEQQALLSAEQLLKRKQSELFGDFEILSVNTSVEKSSGEYIVTAKYILSGNIAKAEYFEVENN